MAKITIPIIAPSRNELDKMHWGARHKLMKSFKAHIEGAILDMGMKVNKITKSKKRKVLIYSYRKTLIKDKENLDGGHKQMVDSLKQLGLIWDDSERYIDLRVFQLEYPEVKTEIFIEDSNKQEVTHVT